jgi:hypothetical protein
VNMRTTGAGGDGVKTPLCTTHAPIMLLQMWLCLARREVIWTSGAPWDTALHLASLRGMTEVVLALVSEQQRRASIFCCWRRFAGESMPKWSTAGHSFAHE